MVRALRPPSFSGLDASPEPAFGRSAATFSASSFSRTTNPWYAVGNRMQLPVRQRMVRHTEGHSQFTSAVKALY